ncbi:MAG: hypothetical protein ACHP65_03010 [Legionellales bacterium]
MSDFKSKLPDFKELTSMSCKFYKSLKAGVEEIIHDYKEKRATTETSEKPAAEVTKESKPVKSKKPSTEAEEKKDSE